MKGELEEVGHVEKLVEEVVQQELLIHPYLSSPDGIGYQVHKMFGPSG